MGILAQVVLPYQSNLPRDVATNTFAIGGVGSSISVGDLVNLTGAISDLYDTSWNGTEPALGTLIHPCVSRVANACSIRYYDISAHLDGTPHGSPFAHHTFTMPPAAAAQGLPEEVSVVLRMEAANRANQRVEVPDGVDPDAKPDRPRQRYTGRIYFGPLVSNGDVLTTGTSSRARVGFLRDYSREALRLVAETIHTNIPGGWLGVWSRSDEAIREVSHISVDDAFDTQRRRGSSPSVNNRVAVAGAGVQVELAA